MRSAPSVSAAERERCLVGIEAHPALALEHLGRQRASGTGCRTPSSWWSKRSSIGRHPSAGALEERDLEVGKALADPAGDEPARRHHHVDRVAEPLPQREPLARVAVAVVVEPRAAARCSACRPSGTGARRSGSRALCAASQNGSYTGSCSFLLPDVRRRPDHHRLEVELLEAALHLRDRGGGCPAAGRRRHRRAASASAAQ